jgi:hypothetical protein
MKKIGALFFSLLLGLSLVSCSSGSKTYEDNSSLSNEGSETPGMFSLISPTLGQTLNEVPTFSWSASENAKYYTLEIASSESFITNNDAYVYYKHDYISTTEFTISASLTQKNVTYYWRVNAHSGAKSTLCNNTFTFFLKSIDRDEVPFSIGNTTDWSVHAQGAPVTLKIDNSNFFGNTQKSLAIKFQKEDTKPVGWIVITKTIEEDTYGTDSLYLRFFYSGDDATAYIRLRDNDGEFWRHKIQLASNAKQTCIMPFSEFTQDTELVTVNNKTFDYYHIKYMEIVFEQTWGDGACLVSEIKTIKKSNYSSLFISKLNFNDYDTASWKWENGYNFGFDIGDDGYSYTLHYDQAANELNSAGMASKGYGFTKIYVNRFLDGGDVIKMDVKYSGSASGNLSFRLAEEDGDFWSYVQSYSTLKTDDYTTIYIPFTAFKASYLGGNGRREFSYLLQLQFGLTNMYGTGTLTYKDVEVVYKADQSEIDTGARVISNDGLIENFDQYTSSSMPFYQWMLSTSNKDEFITLNSVRALGANNTYCGEFAYKSDMSAATYTLPLSIADDSFNGLVISLKDATPKDSASKFAYLSSVSAKCVLRLTLDSGAFYTYAIDALPKVWTTCQIPFSSFAGGSGFTSNSIAALSISLSYVYFDEDGTEDPTYSMSNPVYVDNISLGKDVSSVAINALEKAIKADEGDSTLATMEDCESYSSTDDVLGVWSYGNSYEYNNLELADEASSKGGKHSLKMNYKSYTSTSYALAATIDSSIGDTMKPKGIVVDLKGDGKAKVYINLYLLINNSTYLFRKTIESNELINGWGHYEIGFAAFSDYVSPAGASISASSIVNLSKVTFGMVNSDYSSSCIYMDNLRLSNAITRTTDSSSALN